MKKIVLVFLIVFQLAIFCACDFGAYTHVNASSKSAFVLAGYNIPGASEGLSVDVQLVEEDAYGRKMYRFSCLSPIGEFYADSYNEEEATNIRAYLISQKETEKGVYYLDSVCYMIRPSWDDFTDDLLEELKALNHWGAELDSDVLCFRPFPDSKLSGTKVDPLFAEVNYAYTQYTGKDPNGDNVYIQYVCNDTNGKCLAFIRENNETATAEENHAYAVVVNPYNQKDRSYYVIELLDFYQHNNDIIALKEKAGWISPKE